MQLVWLNLILSLAKCWEVRQGKCQLGRTYLFEVGGKRILGHAHIVQCLPLSEMIFTHHFDKHHISPEQLADLKYTNPHAWVLTDVVRYDVPIDHDGGRYMITWGRPYPGSSGIVQNLT